VKKLLAGLFFIKKQLGKFTAWFSNMQSPFWEPERLSIIRLTSVENLFYFRLLVVKTG
jgi:hypothetical protein